MKRLKPTTIPAPKSRTVRTISKPKIATACEKEPVSSARIETILAGLARRTASQHLLLLITPTKTSNHLYRVHVLDRRVAVKLKSIIITETDLYTLKSSETYKRYSIMLSSKYIDLGTLVLKMPLITNLMDTLTGKGCKIKRSQPDMFRHFQHLAKRRQKEEQQEWLDLFQKQQQLQHSERLQQLEEWKQRQESKLQKLYDRLEKRLGKEKSTPESTRSYEELQQQQWKTLYEQQQLPAVHQQQVQEEATWSKFQEPLLPVLNPKTNMAPEQTQMQNKQQQQAAQSVAPKLKLLHQEPSIPTTFELRTSTAQKRTEQQLLHQESPTPTTLKVKTSAEPQETQQQLLHEESPTPTKLEKKTSAEQEETQQQQPPEVSEIPQAVVYLANLELGPLMHRINSADVPDENDLTMFFDYAERQRLKLYIRPDHIALTRQPNPEIEFVAYFHVECFRIFDTYEGRITLDFERLQQHLQRHVSLLPSVKVVDDALDIVPIPRILLLILRFLVCLLCLEELYDKFGQFVFDLYTYLS